MDIGSNSVKYILARAEGHSFELLKSGSTVTRLGRDLEKNGLLAEKSIEDTLVFLRNIKDTLSEAGCQKVTVVATSAVRDARNPERIGDAVTQILKTRLRILSGLEEAELSLEGARAAALQCWGDDRGVFIDVGGSSTEVGVCQPVFKGESFQAGAVRCHEALGLDKIPVANADWTRAQKGIEKFFPKNIWLKLSPAFKGLDRVMAVGGTLLLAARLAGVEAPDSSALLIDTATLEALNEKVRALSLTEREALPHMERGRADILCAGILILTHLLRRLGADKVWLTSWGLRHGILLREFRGTP